MIQVDISVNGIKIFTATADELSRLVETEVQREQKRYHWSDSRRHHGELVHLAVASPLDLAARLLDAADEASDRDPTLDPADYATRRATAKAQRLKEAAKLIGNNPESSIIGDLAAASALEVSDNTDPDLDPIDQH